MFKYERLKSKFNARFYDDFVPVDHIQENIYDLTLDINKIAKISFEIKDKDSVFLELCGALKKKLCDRRDYFQKKFENLQHLESNEKNDSYSNYYTNQF